MKTETSIDQLDSVMPLLLFIVAPAAPLADLEMPNFTFVPNHLLTVLFLTSLTSGFGGFSNVGLNYNTILLYQVKLCYRPSGGGRDVSGIGTPLHTVEPCHLGIFHNAYPCL